MAEDLAHLLPSSPLTGNSSMCATNTVSDQTGSLTAPGSPSEQTEAIPARAPAAAQQQGGPQVPVGSLREKSGLDSSYRPGPVAWALLPQNGYSSKEM
jgi:hypothetical protein